MVPHWVRGHESLEIVGRRAARARRCSGSATASARRPTASKAKLLVVRNFEELDALGDRVKGKIVLFNVPFTTYGETVRYRMSGPSRAAALGAVAMLHSCGRSSRPPHAPHRRAALRRRSAANSRRRGDDRGRGRGCSACRTGATTVRLKLMMEAQFLPDAESANVVGELRGRELPDEVRRHRRPHRLVGRRHRIDGRWWRVRGDVGGAAPHEAAEPAAAPDGPRGAVDQRGERRPRRSWLPRSAPGRARRGT